MPTSRVLGDIGVSPGFMSSITGFSLVDHGGVYCEPFIPLLTIFIKRILLISFFFFLATSTQSNGKIYAADSSNSPVPAAVSAMEAAYTNANNQVPPDATELGAGSLNGLSLHPGMYVLSIFLLACYITSLIKLMSLVINGQLLSLYQHRSLSTVLVGIVIFSKLLEHLLHLLELKSTLLEV